MPAMHSSRSSSMSAAFLCGTNASPLHRVQFSLLKDKRIDESPELSKFYAFFPSRLFYADARIPSSGGLPIFLFLTTMVRIDAVAAVATPTAVVPLRFSLACEYFPSVGRIVVPRRDFFPPSETPGHCRPPFFPDG